MILGHIVGKEKNVDDTPRGPRVIEGAFKFTQLRNARICKRSTITENYIIR